MSQKLPLNDFKWVEYTSQFTKDFIENHNEDSDEGYFLQVDVQYLENLHKLLNDLPFLPKRIKIEKKSKNLYQTCMIKKMIKSWISFEKSSWTH